MQTENTELDLNNPDSWPDDLEKLHAIADTGVPNGEDDGVVVEDFPDDLKLGASEAETKDGDPKPADDDNKDAEVKPGEGDEEQPDGDAAGDDKPDGETDDKAAKADAKPAEDGAADPPTSAEDGQIDGVLTRDGKHFLPYQVVVDLKTQNRELQEKLQTSAKSLTATDGAQAPTTGDAKATGPVAPAGDKPMWQRPAEEIQAFLKTVEDEYGELPAQQELRLMQIEAREAQEKHDRAQAEQARQQQLALTVDAAVEQNPVLHAWREDDKSEWYERAVTMHEQLVKFDPNYAQKQIGDQFDLLIGKVEAVYGESPHRQTITKLDDKSNGGQKPAEARRTSVDDALKTAQAAPVTSMSQIPGGAPTEVSDVDKLQKLSERQIMGLMESKPVDAMNEFLNELA